MHTQVSIGGVPIDALDRTGALAAIDEYVRSGRPHQLVTINLDFLAIAERNPTFHRVLREADLAIADGQPIIWLSYLAGAPLPERLAGVDLMQAACELAAQRGYRPFLLGARPGVAAKAATALQQRYPGLVIAGCYCPPFGPLSEAESRRMLAAIHETQPDMLFVALGAPRQDLWIAEHRHELGVPVSVGVGGAFDLIAGELPRAPRWMQQVGLEWAFRLAQEPTRLWRRYILNDIPTLLRLLVSWRKIRVTMKSPPPLATTATPRTAPIADATPAVTATRRD